MPAIHYKEHYKENSVSIAEPAQVDAKPLCSSTFSLKALGKARPLRVALLGYRSHPFVGGQGIYLRYLSRALANLGHQVDVYSGPPYPNLDSGVDLIKVPSLDLYACEKPFRALKFKHLRSFTDSYEWWSKISGGFAEPYTFGRRVEKLLRHKDYDVIHDNQSLSYGLMNLLSRHQKNIVATIHHPMHRDRTLAIDAEPDRLMKWLKKRWYSFIHMQEKVVAQLPTIVTVSECSKQDIVEAFNIPADHVHVLGNGVDTDMFRPLPTISRAPCRLITTSSSDQPLKGLKFLLLALDQLRQAFPNIQLDIIGELNPKGPNAKLIKTLKLEPHIVYHTQLTSEAIVELYAQSTVAVCPSLYEGFGLPLAEAMACEIPVVTTDGGALKEVAGDAAVVVPSGDATALAENIQSLLEDPQKQQRFGRLGRQRIESEYCWHAVATRMSQLYFETLKTQ